jgi:two-component system, sensor histidine kinase PhcS
LDILALPAKYSPQLFWEFLGLRLLCSALLIFIWWLVKTPFGFRNYRLLGLTLPALPTFFISLMIYKTDGPDSPYYAGLNLVLLGAAIVLRWSLWDSLIVFFEVVVCYFVVCFIYGHSEDKKVFFNNSYFLLVTGVFVVIGSHFYNRLRFREFSLRHELDKNRKALETSLQQLKENEMQLVQSEKLASLGRMSAGIIHEINNPLNFATTGLYTLRNKGKHLPADQQEEYKEILTDVGDGLKRVQNIVSDLRMFTHPNTEQLDSLMISEVLTPALRFLSNEWKDTIQIEQKFDEHQTILGNKNKLIQVIVNILQNSLDALRKKTFPNGEKPTITVEGRLENGRSFLSIRDNGPGIDQQHLDKIFEPFFTTKDVGEGMGLGLSICHRIVEECDGTISVKTELGKFCEFTLEFPAKG